MGVALVQIGEPVKPLVNVIDMVLQSLFRVVAMVMRLAPLGAGAGMAFTIGKYGTCIYLTMAAIFVAQATHTPLTLWDQLTVLGVLLLTSKGSAGVAGAGFVTLAATLSVFHGIPMIGLVLLLGVDRFLNEARAVTNLIGNGIGTIAIAKWDGSFDKAKAAKEIAVMNEGGGKRAQALNPARVGKSQV